MNKKEKIKRQYGGYSSSKGVTFYNKFYAVGAYYDEEKNMVRTIVKNNYSDENLHKLFIKLGGKKSKFMYYFMIIIENLFLLCLSAFFQYVIRNTIFFYVVYGLMQLAILGIIVYNLVHFNKAGKELPKYHAAEHMVRNSFDKFTDLLSIDKMKNMSRFHPRCGIALFTNELFLLNLFFALALVFKTYMPPVYLIFLASHIGFSINPYSFILQYLATTKRPDDKHLMVARRAYERLLELEEDDFIADNEELSYKRYANLNSVFDEDEYECDFYMSEILDIDKQIEYELALFNTK